MTAPTTAGEIRTRVVRSLHQLESLREQGRIALATDQYDPQWLDVSAATEAAIAALSRAAEAMLVLDTLPDADGGFPPIPEQNPIP